MRMWMCAFLLLFTSLPPLTAQSRDAAMLTPQNLSELNVYVKSVMRQWRVPGLSVAIVKNGKVVLTQGYGVRELGEPAKVNADTLFDIGSNTKAFTAAALGTLVESGRLQWDTPVTDVIKNFRLSDPYITRNVTLHDLLTHYTGYCDPLAAWYTSNDDDILARMYAQKPRYAFRTTFCYNNVQYLLASRFIPNLTGQSWLEYVTDRLFRPLDMDRTVADSEELESSRNVASPHGLVDGKVEVIHRYWPHNMDIMAPVGGIWSSANDMSHWLEMLLADGNYNGRAILSAKLVQAMEAPQVIIQPIGGAGNSGVGKQIREVMPGGHFYTYGLGLFVQDYGGHLIVWHDGDIDGMASQVALAPDSGLGIVVLSNMNLGLARFAITTHILQAMLGLPLQDLEPALLAGSRKNAAALARLEAKLAGPRVAGAEPSLPLPEYVGDYTDKLDGVAHVYMSNGRLMLRLGNPNFEGRLVPWNGNTFRVNWDYRFYGHAYLSFDLDRSKSVGRIKLFLCQPFPMKLHYERALTARAPAKHDE